MSLILCCTVCDDPLPNQYAPLGGRCGGYVCKGEIEAAIAKAEPRRKLSITTKARAA